jgi:hypothetical protein
MAAAAEQRKHVCLTKGSHCFCTSRKLNASGVRQSPASPGLVCGSPIHCATCPAGAAASSRPASAGRPLRGKEPRRVSRSTVVNSSRDASSTPGARTEPPVTRSMSRLGFGLFSPVPEDKPKLGRCALFACDVHAASVQLACFRLILLACRNVRCPTPKACRCFLCLLCILQPTHHACTDSWAALLHSAEGETQLWLGAKAAHIHAHSNNGCTCCAVCRPRARRRAPSSRPQHRSCTRCWRPGSSRVCAPPRPSPCQMTLSWRHPSAATGAQHQHSSR